MITSRRNVVTTLIHVCVFVALCTSVRGQGTGIHLDFPNGGEIFYTTRDTVINVRWSGVDDTTKVNLDVSMDAGQTWRLLVDSVSGLSYQWHIAGRAVGSAYRLRVAKVRPPTPLDDIIYTKHNSPVYDAVWSPSGMRVASISADAHVWDSWTGGLVEATILAGPRPGYNGLDWSRDSLHIVVGGEDQIARVYDATTSQLTQSLNIPAVIKECHFNPQSTEILIGSDDARARVFVMPSAVAAASYPAAGALEQVVWSPNGQRILICGSVARVQNRAGGPPTVFSGHAVSVDAGAWSPDGSLICTVGGDASIRMWDALTTVEKWVIERVPDGVRCVAFNTEGTLVAVGGGDSSVVVYDVADGSVRHTINNHAQAVRMITFSRDGRYLATASDDDFARVYDFETGTTVRDLRHDLDVTTVRWAPDDGRILTASADGKARIWQIREIVIEADSSDASFAIAPPPPAFARFITSGDTLQLGEETIITLRMEGAQFIELSEVDSVRFKLAYDASMLHLLSSSVPVMFEDDSANYNVLTIQSIALPFEDTLLMTLRLRATLGADSITSMFLSRIELIGNGPGLAVEKLTDTILIRGLCRADGLVRLYNPLGESLQLSVRRSPSHNTTVEAVLAESGATTIEVFDLFGRLLWSDQATSSELLNRRVERVLDASLTGRSPLLVLITTPTQRIGKLTLE